MLENAIRERQATQKAARAKLAQAFDLQILPALYDRRPWDAPEMGDWFFHEQAEDVPHKSEPVGRWHRYLTESLLQEDTQALQEKLRKRFKDVIGDSSLDGHEFCPITLGNPDFPKRYGAENKEEIYISDQIVDALIAQNKQVPLQDIIEEYHGLVKSRMSLLEDLSKQLNQASGYAVWYVRYDELATGVGMPIPATSYNDWGKEVFDFGEAQAIMEKALQDNPFPVPATLAFEKSSDRDSNYAYMSISTEGAENLEEIVQHLTTTIQPAVRNAMRSMLLKADPNHALYRIGMEDFKEEMLAMGPGEHTIKDIFETTNKNQLLQEVSQLRGLSQYFKNLGDALASPDMKKNLKERLYKLVPALAPEDGTPTLAPGREAASVPAP